MGDPDTGALGWYSPDPRAIFPLERFHVPKSLTRVLRRGKFEARTDTAFEAVMRACAESRPGRWETWLDEPLIPAYVDLHRMGHAHSVEAWLEDRLVGGLYGVHIGAAFFGESMFSLPEQGGTDASKVCLVQLVLVMRERGFRLLDTQFTTPHLARFGCVEVAKPHYLELLDKALAEEATWPRPGRISSAAP